MEILVDVFPVAPRRHVRLVHDPNVRILLVGFGPPVEAQAVDWAVRESLEVGHGLPVGDSESGHAGTVLNGH